MKETFRQAQKRKFLETKRIQEKKLASIENREWYSLRSLFGNDLAIFYVILGAREAGKSYDTMKYVIRQWKQKGKPFTWLRLTEASQKKLLINNAADLVDADIRRQFELDLSVKGNTVYDGDKIMCKVLALSTYYNDKGIALFDKDFDLGYNIVLDEMNRERCEKNTFDITYAFVNQMENLVRSTKRDIKVIMIGNTTIEAADIMCCFNFIPESFGRFYLFKNKKLLRKYLDELKQAKNDKERAEVDKKYSNIDFGKRCVIDYIPNSEAYKNRRHGTISQILTPDDSNVTNEIRTDISLIDKRRLRKPTAVIKFFASQDKWFTIWDGKVVKSYNKEDHIPVIPMRKFLDEVFSVEVRDNYINMYDARLLHFRDLITQKKFKKELQLLKGSKY